MGTKVNLVIDQDTDFSHTFTYNDGNNNPIDVTGYTAQSSLKAAYTANSIAASFNVTLSNGFITISLPRTVSANMAFGRYVYDVHVISSANIASRPYEGIATITPEVS